MSQELPNPPATASAQLVALRLVIVSSVIDVVLVCINFGHSFFSMHMPRSFEFLVTPTWSFLAPMVLLMIHHVGRYGKTSVTIPVAHGLTKGSSTFGPTLFPIKLWIDIALTLLEAGCEYRDCVSISAL